MLPHAKELEMHSQSPGPGTDVTESRTLQLGALVALALAPSGADAPAAVFLLGEAREGVAATLGRGAWTGVTGCPAPTWPPSSGPFPPPATQPAGPTQF